jgi:hypothetical protein
MSQQTSCRDSLIAFDKFHSHCDSDAIHQPSAITTIHIFFLSYPFDRSMMRSYAVAAVLVAVCLSESLVVAYSVRGSLRMSSKTPQTKKLLIPTATATDALLPRRVALQSLFSGALGIASAALGNHPAAAADIKRAAAADGLLEQVFFGVGCFWHIQRECHNGCEIQSVRTSFVSLT